MLRWLRWHLAKRRLVAEAFPPQHVRIWSERHKLRPGDLAPNAGPYDGLAALWEAATDWYVPDYGHFLPVAAEHYGTAVNSVLDLGCGTGLLSRKIAKWAKAVVGLDASEAMLRQCQAGNIRYARGDFRDFSLGETFDAVVCGSDSLNYVETPAELSDVFRCVRRHLRPGGLFAFDVLDHQWCRQLNGLVTRTETGLGEVKLYRFYDEERRVGQWLVQVGDAVEFHRRVPIEEGDVTRWADAVGLEVTEHFSQNTYRLLRPPAARQFYLLRVSQARTRQI